MADIRLITEFFKKNDMEMLRAVYLAAFGTLRRSEICGLVGPISELLPV